MAVPADLKCALLYYVAGAEQIYVVLLTNDGVTRQFPLLGWDEAFPLIDNFNDAIYGTRSNSQKNEVLLRFSEEWGRRLLPPDDELRSFDILTIIPQHTIYGVPLHAVRTEDGAFVGTRHGVSYCSSGSLLRLAASRNVARNTSSETPPRSCFALIGDVIHGRTDLYRPVVTTFEQFLDVDPQCEGMPRERLKNSSSDVIAVICHGHYDDIEPRNSGLLLDHRRDGFNSSMRPIVLGNGTVASFRDYPFRFPPPFLDPDPEALPEILTVDELKVDADCGAQLVALLGCSTAAAAAFSSDDVGSLAEQWLRLGTPSVLANSWESDVQFVERWCERFLAKWITETRPKALAWKDANREFADTSPLFEWAGLTLWGDWV